VGRLRSPYDREILRLALPALGALAAEPLYVLVDTAIVGRLGRPQLAALGLAGTVLAGAFTIFNFLTYGTTAVVARASGAGEHERAARPFDNDAAGPPDPARLRRLLPDPELMRRRAAGETLRRLARDYGVAHTTQGRWFARPEVARQLHELRRRLQAPS
jgi:hypothetical protein